MNQIVLIFNDNDNDNYDPDDNKADKRIFGG